MMTFYIGKEHNDLLDKRIAMIRKLGARLCPVTQSAISDEVAAIAMLSAYKPDEWTLCRLYSLYSAIRVCVVFEEAGT